MGRLGREIPKPISGGKNVYPSLRVIAVRSLKYRGSGIRV